MNVNFFKAGKPFNNLNGFWGNQMWTNGHAGPLGMAEARRLGSTIGGTILEFPVPLEMEDFIFLVQNAERAVSLLRADDVEVAVEEPLEVEFNGGLFDVARANPIEKPAEELFKDAFEEGSALSGRLEDDNEPRFSEGVEKSWQPQELTPEQIQDFVADGNIEIPHYNDQRRALADAKEDGIMDYTAIIGNSRSKDDTLKAYLMLRLIEEDTE